MGAFAPASSAGHHTADVCPPEKITELQKPPTVLTAHTHQHTTHNTHTHTTQTHATHTHNTNHFIDP